jgi:pepF/M3 family oligoendopeptidase
MTGVFPGLDSPGFAAAHEGLKADLRRLAEVYDRHGVRGRPQASATTADLAAFDQVLTATNAVLDQVRSLSAYLTTFLSTEAGNERAATLYSQLQVELASLQKLTTRFEAWVARLGPSALTSASGVAADHAHALRQAAVSAEHQMPEAEEGLYADLRLTGSSAWNKLHGDVTALLTGSLNGEAVPITVLRGMATDPDGARREKAFRAELAAWHTVEVPLAAALNGIKGEANTLNRHRGWRDSLGPALLANSVELPALEAMQSAAVASFPDFRRFLRVKARLLGHPNRLPWWDLFAPVPGEVVRSWDDATAAVRDGFATYSQQLSRLVERALHERWVDAEPRAGKRGGAFCLSVRGDESRVLLNFDGSFDSVRTLAHELGHAYHNTNLAGRTPLQRRTPMALAETASIFCETILVQSGLAAASPAERLALLNVDLEGACQVVVDIHSRFLFEREVFSRREKGVVPSSELCQIMTDSQLQTYGDALEPSALHPYMWAVKPHYYSSAYYNWPYCFGLLFGIGLYSRYKEDPDRFRAGYDDLLSSTGLQPAADLANRFGIDVSSVDFWSSSLDVIRARIDDFERLAADEFVRPRSL